MAKMMTMLVVMRMMMAIVMMVTAMMMRILLVMMKRKALPAAKGQSIVRKKQKCIAPFVQNVSFHPAAEYIAN